MTASVTFYQERGANLEIDPYPIIEMSVGSKSAIHPVIKSLVDHHSLLN